MSEVLPAYSGLTINTVNYRYTTLKATPDSFLVTVQNLNSTGTGYLFRSQDDWTGLPGNTITKTVPVNNYQLASWGPGQIKTQGLGTIKDVSVVYGYKYDSCSLVPVTDTNCPNYKPSVSALKLLDASQTTETVGTNSQLILETEENLEKYRKFLLLQAEEKRLKNPVARGTNVLITDETIEHLKELEAVNNAAAFKLYSMAMPGGTYPETIKYVDKVLPDSRSSRRLNLSQQQLHNSLVDLQYNR